MQQLTETLRKYWGYDSFRPLQTEAMRSVLAGRDSVVVLPTGGGKSLCYQVPAVCMPSLAVIVSPLISLMKDQVDALTDCGVPAACVNSSMPSQERRQVADDVRAGKLKLLYLSPERLVSEQTIRFLQEVRPSFFAIDEAHCISDWGHDFRPEYRALKQLKQWFPDAAVHAYTATATERVRQDIARELALEQPEMLVGSFDRPNLVYRVARRGEKMKQICDVIDRHPQDSGIIYCIRRKDTEEIAASLTASGRRAAAYHAGMSDDDRRRRQDDFAADRTRIICATIAFGMGIDKSDVRYVIHTGAPKSLESYQQESGRAGRDGLEAECWLLYSPGDFATWRKMQSELPPPAFKAAMELLAGIDRFCTTAACRHATIMKYFGQTPAAGSCGACDICLDEVELVDEPLIVGQKILSCVVRLEQNFGVYHTAKVLTGSQEQRIVDLGHQRLSTYGILGDQTVKSVGAWIEQLIDQEFLERVGEYNVLKLTASGGELLRGQRTPRLTRPVKAGKEAKVSRESWEGVDRELFETLRKLRREIADAKGLPPFVVFSDATLRDLARRRPSSREKLLTAHGVGDKKADQYGEPFLNSIREHCLAHDVAMDAAEETPQPPPPALPVAQPNELKRQAMARLAKGESIEQVCESTGRARSTVVGYLIETIREQGICDASVWVDEAVAERVRAAAQQVGTNPLRPIFLALDEQVGYEEIKITVACLENEA